MEGGGVFFSMLRYMAKVYTVSDTIAPSTLPRMRGSVALTLIAAVGFILDVSLSLTRTCFIGQNGRGRPWVRFSFKSFLPPHLFSQNNSSYFVPRKNHGCCSEEVKTTGVVSKEVNPVSAGTPADPIKSGVIPH